MTRKNTKWTLDSVREFYASHECTFISEEYKTMLDKYTFICKCGREHTSRFESYYKHNHRCKHCAGEEMSERRRLKKNVIVKTLEDKGFTYLNHYWDGSENAETDRNWLYVDCICRNGHIQIGKHYHSIIRAKFACIPCTTQMLKNVEKLPLDRVKEMVESQGMKLISNEYANYSTPIDVICVCGNKYSAPLSSITQGHRCGCQRGGENHYNYNPNLTEEERQDRRQYSEYYQWVRDVYERDNYTCQKCGKRGGSLHAHHIHSYAKYKDKRVDIDNGATLCEKDHKAFHKLYGLKDFTPEDFTEFLGK